MNYEKEMVPDLFANRQSIYGGLLYDVSPAILGCIARLFGCWG